MDVAEMSYKLEGMELTPCKLVKPGSIGDVNKVNVFWELFYSLLSYK